MYINMILIVKASAYKNFNNYCINMLKSAKL